MVVGFRIVLFSVASWPGPCRLTQCEYNRRPCAGCVKPFSILSDIEIFVITHTFPNVVYIATYTLPVISLSIGGGVGWGVGVGSVRTRRVHRHPDEISYFRISRRDKLN